MIGENGARLNFMDNLRALTMLAGIVLHAGLAFSPLMANMWPSANAEKSVFFDIFFHSVHSFRMPLFFIIAGFFAHFIMNKRGALGMLKNRALRVLLPFVLFLPLVAVGMLWPMGWAMENVNNLSPLLTFINSFKDAPNAPELPPTTMHLWFLYYLVMFYLLYWVASVLISDTLAERLSNLSLLVVGLLVFAAISVGLWFTFTPVPAPETFLPQLWAVLYFGAFFSFGVWLFNNLQVLDFAKALWFVIGVLAVAFNYAYLPETLSFATPPPTTQEHAASVISQAVAAIALSLFCLSATKRFLSNLNKTMRYWADASYWLYIIHLPLVMFMQYHMMDIEMNVWLKFVISLGGTLVIGIVTYALLVRHTPIGWLLNGKRQKEKTR